MKKLFLKISQNSQKNSCATVSFLTKVQVFPCEFCKIFKNTFSTEHLRAIAFEVYRYLTFQRFSPFLNIS